MVMVYFGIGNFLLKIKRSRLPRPVYAPAWSVALAILFVLTAVYLNIQYHPKYLLVFLQYFIPAVLLIYVLLSRKQILQYLLIILTGAFEKLRRWSVAGRLHLRNYLYRLTRQEFVYFTKGDDISVLNKVMIYVQENEITTRLKIVTVLKEHQELSPEFLRDFDALDRAYPEIDIEYIQLTGIFGPQMIQRLCEEWNIPPNFMFISSPGSSFPHRLQDLHGVRLII